MRERKNQTTRLLLLCWVLLSAAAGCAVNPVTQQRQLVLLSEAEEVQMGEEAYPIYTQMSEGLFQDEALQTYVNAVGQKLAAVSHRPELAYRFNVVNDSAINAYALPGGKISITRGLISRMRNEAQLASVLGHEIGHVTARHSAAGMTRQKIAGVLTNIGAVALEIGGVKGSDLILQGGMIAGNLVLQKYSRDQERQSDELGMEYMTALGYNPEGMVQTMEILNASHEGEPNAVEAMFMSHPLTGERIATARKRSANQDPTLRVEDKLGAEAFQRATTHLHAVAPAYAEMDQAKKALGEGRTGEAVQRMERATEEAPGEALLWCFRAAAEAESGDTRRAHDSAEKAVQLYPGLFRARLTAGVLAYELGDAAGSMAHLDAADSLVPDQPQVMYYRGRNWERQGQRESAAKAYYAVLQRVREGPMAEYCYNKLVEWGYLKKG